MRPRTDTDKHTETHTDRHTHTRVTSIHFSWSTTHAKCNKIQNTLQRFNIKQSLKTVKSVVQVAINNGVLSRDHDVLNFVRNFSVRFSTTELGKDNEKYS